VPQDGRITVIPKAFPKEIRRDVIAVARNGEAPLSQIPKDFGISESCLHRWLKHADIGDVAQPGASRQDSAAAGSEEADPATRARSGSDAPRGRVSVTGCQPKIICPRVLDLAADGVPVAVTCRVLGFSTPAFYKRRIHARWTENAHANGSGANELSACHVVGW
jgi:transposase-like protein